jgi:putative transcriptional regulator
MKSGLLIAAPTMKDHWFEQAVVLLCQFSSEGALGLVVNKDGPVSIGDVVERLDLQVPTSRGLGQTWWGGPVETGAGFVVWRGRVEGDEGWNVGDDVAVSPSAECLGRLLTGGSAFHLCLGYAGWAPGQLDHEIQTGSWLFADLDSSILFDTPLPQRWDRALGLLGLSRDTVWMKPVDE